MGRGQEQRALLITGKSNSFQRTNGEKGPRFNQYKDSSISNQQLKSYLRKKWPFREPRGGETILIRKGTGRVNFGVASAGRDHGKKGVGRQRKAWIHHRGKSFTPKKHGMSSRIKSDNLAGGDPKFVRTM